MYRMSQFASGASFLAFDWEKRDYGIKGQHQVVCNAAGVAGSTAFITDFVVEPKN
jgi:hypothetical protein